VNTHLHLVPTLRMSGTIPLLPHYVFMVWTGRNLRAALRHSIKIFRYFNLNSESKQQLCKTTAVHMSESLPLNRCKPTFYRSADKIFFINFHNLEFSTDRGIKKILLCNKVSHTFALAMIKQSKIY